MDIEEWRAAPGYEGFYEVSSGGRVRSVERTVNAPYGKQRVLKGKILVLHPDPQGYLRAGLSREGKLTPLKVSRLVALAFHGHQPSEIVARHLDGDKSNNTRSNIAWGTSGDNSQDSLRHGTHFMANKTHCVRGHLLGHPNQVNNRGAPEGTRICKACHNAASWLRRHPGSDMQTEADRYYAIIMSA